MQKCSQSYLLPSQSTLKWMVSPRVLIRLMYLSSSSQSTLKWMVSPRLAEPAMAVGRLSQSTLKWMVSPSFLEKLGAMKAVAVHA